METVKMFFFLHRSVSKVVSTLKMHKARAVSQVTSRAPYQPVNNAIITKWALVQALSRTHSFSVRL